jgi:hypothetical protein
MGHFPASDIVLNEKQPSCLVYEACGAKYGYIKSYSHDGQGFVGACLQDITSGDGAPEENNRKLSQLFPKDKVIKWTKAPNQASHATSEPAPGAVSSSREG